MDAAVAELPRNQYHPIATRALQKAALAALEQHGTIVDAARAIGVDPHTISRWCKSETYKAKVLAAQEFADRFHTLDQIKSNFKQRALAGKEDGQSAIIGMFLAKRIDPAYRDNAIVQVNAVGPSMIQMNFTAPTPQPVVPKDESA